MQGKVDYSFIGKNIQIIRRRSGLTQVDLAKRIRIHQGPLSMIENGENIPSARIIFEISKALNVSSDALFARNQSELHELIKKEQKNIYRIDLDNEKLTNQTEATINVIMDYILALEDICNAQKHSLIPLTLPVEPTYAGIEKLVRRVRDIMGVRDAVIFDYFELFEVCGLRVIILPLFYRIFSASFYDSINENAFFFINCKHNPEKQIFRLLYELGHLFLFMWERKVGHMKFFEIKGESLDIHHAASKFAALFLMPEYAVQSTVSQLGIKKSQWDFDLLLRIKHRFGVSAESFLYRLNELDLIDSDLNASLHDKILSFYKSTNYKEPDSCRRILTPNGRIWDLVHTAKNNIDYKKEVHSIEEFFKKSNIIKI